MPVTLMDEQTYEDYSLEELIGQYQRAKGRQEAADTDVKMLNEEIKRRMREANQKSKTIEWGDRMLRAVYSGNTSLKIDESGLKKAIGARAFHKVTVEKVDRTKLNAAVESGELDPIIVKQYIRSESVPQLRLYLVDAEENDEPS